jgi:cytochrome c-type biogenesis protein CcmE
MQPRRRPRDRVFIVVIALNVISLVVAAVVLSSTVAHWTTPHAISTSTTSR